jgi:hypothetical protein
MLRGMKGFVDGEVARPSGKHLNIGAISARKLK